MESLGGVVYLVEERRFTQLRTLRIHRIPLVLVVRELRFVFFVFFVFVFFCARRMGVGPNRRGGPRFCPCYTSLATMMGVCICQSTARCLFVCLLL
jgi:hypothetical protein